MLNQITPHLWLSLSQKVRTTLAQELGIAKSSHPEVMQDSSGSHLVSDGHTVQDLFVGITIEKMQAYLGSVENNDFYSLFMQCVEKIEPPIIVEEEQQEPIVVEPVSETTTTETSTSPVAEKKFCDFCDSKGGRHKITCTKPKV